jgi:hypothetical protein
MLESDDLNAVMVEGRNDVDPAEGDKRQSLLQLDNSYKRVESNRNPISNGGNTAVEPPKVPEAKARRLRLPRRLPKRLPKRGLCRSPFIVRYGFVRDKCRQRRLLLKFLANFCKSKCNYIKDQEIVRTGFYWAGIC